MTTEEMLNLFKSHIDKGDSVPLAVKKVCGSNANLLSKKLRSIPEYVDIINKSLENRGLNQRFYRDKNGVIRQKRLY
jgi:hypothetical protein